MAITNASRLADFGSGIGTAGAVLQIDNSANEIGIGTTNPNATLTVGNIGASGTSIYVHGDARITGVLTATTFVGNVTGDLTGDVTGNVTGSASTAAVPGISTQGHSVFNTINASGILTASQFYGDGSTLSGVGVPGVSTTGHSVFNTINVSGISTFTEDVKIGTAATTAVFDISTGQLGIGTINPSNFTGGAGNLVVGSGVEWEGMTIYAGTGHGGNIYFADGLSGADLYDGWFQFNHSTSRFHFGFRDNTKLLINSNGDINASGVCTATTLYGDGSNLTGTVNTGKAIAMAMIFG